MPYIEMHQEVFCMPIIDEWIDIKKNSLYPVGSVSILEDGLFSQNLVRNKGVLR